MSYKEHLRTLLVFRLLQREADYFVITCVHLGYDVLLTHSENEEGRNVELDTRMFSGMGRVYLVVYHYGEAFFVFEYYLLGQVHILRL